jgi:hypothetical protein
LDNFVSQTSTGTGLRLVEWKYTLTVQGFTVRMSIKSKLQKAIEDPKKIPRWLRFQFTHRTWYLWERLGFHVVPDHYYFPIPNLQRLQEEEPWTTEYATEGVDLNADRQLEQLRTFGSFVEDYPDPDDSFASHGDGAAYYGILRDVCPNKVIEVGSGDCTVLALDAIEDGGLDTEIQSIEPYPRPELLSLAESDSRLSVIEERVQDVDFEVFEQLESGDILFIDSSHVGEIGSDVLYLYLHVLPQLPEGVYIHAHDIAFPFEFSRERIMKKKRFWSERHLVAAFLQFNSGFEVIWAGKYLCQEHREKLVLELPGFDGEGDGGSLWLRKTK